MAIITLDPTTGEYHARYTCAETAALIRLALRARYPNLAARAFSVTSHPYNRKDRALGTVTVRWQGGTGAPTLRAVQHIVGRYEGVNLDPATDTKIQRVVLLDSYRCHFGAEFVFCERLRSERGAAAPLRATSFRHGEQNQ